MNCTITSAIVFVFLSLTYGSAFAAVAEGMKYFSPCAMIFYRMLFGAIVATVIMFVRVATQKGYWQIVQAHWNSGIIHVLWIGLGGLLFHGLPHCTIAIAQQWVSSASVQVAQPLATAFGAILSHFVLDDEPFNLQKTFVLIFSLVGVALNSLPSFLGAGSGSGSVSDIAIGYVLLVVGVAFFGFAAVVMKWKTPNADASASAVIQLLFSVVVVFIIELIWDGPKKLAEQSSVAPGIAWLWPFLVGSLGTGLAATGYNYLVAAWGAAGANLVPFGQIIVGVIIGVAFLNEWGKYTVWQIIVSIIGILLLIVAIILGFYEKKQPQSTAEEVPQELEEIEIEKKEDLIEHKEDLEGLPPVDNFQEPLEQKQHPEIAEL